MIDADGIVIDALREDDAPRCAELEAVLFPGDDPWTARAFCDELRMGHHYLAARSAGEARLDTARSAGEARLDTARSAGGARLDTARSAGEARMDTVRSAGEARLDTARSAREARLDTARSAGGARLDTARSAGGALVGYAGLAFVAGPPQAEAEIHTIGVDPRHQRRGIGRELLRRLLAVADGAGAAVFLEVRTDNEPAHALYDAEGFRIVGLRRRYYRPSGADAHTMRREPTS